MAIMTSTILRMRSAVEGWERTSEALPPPPAVLDWRRERSCPDAAFCGSGGLLLGHVVLAVLAACEGIPFLDHPGIEIDPSLGTDSDDPPVTTRAPGFTGDRGRADLIGKGESCALAAPVGSPLPMQQRNSCPIVSDDEDVFVGHGKLLGEAYNLNRLAFA